MRTTINFPDADFRRLEALAREAERRPTEMIVLLAREALKRRLSGAERLRRFRSAMERIYGGLDEETLRSLDARGREPAPGRRRRRA